MTYAEIKYKSGADTYTIADPRVTAAWIDVARQYGTTAAAVNAAITDASANAAIQQGRPVVVYLDARTWDLDEQVYLKDGVTLQGAGRDATILKPAGAIAGLRGYNITNVTVQDLTIDGINQTNGSSVKGIDVVRATGCTFRRLRIMRPRYSCLGLDYPSFHTIVDDCIFEDGAYGQTPPRTGGGNGMGTVSGLLTEEDFIVTNCTAIRCRAGVIVEVRDTAPGKGQGARISDCYSIDCEIGFENAGAPLTTFSDCVAIDCWVGYKFGEGDHTPITDLPTGLASMDNCFAYNSTEHGVHAYFDGPDDAPFPGLIIQNSTIKDSGDTGILVTLAGYDVDNLTIRNTTVTGSVAAGIDVVSTGVGVMRDLSIVGNDVLDNAVGIHLDANLTRGRIEANAIVDTTGTAQPLGLHVATGRTLTGTAFDGGMIVATVPVDIDGTLTGCSVGLIPGWTRGAGAPTVKAPAATVYQRTDGSAATLLYVNTDGGTTWSAFA